MMPLWVLIPATLVAAAVVEGLIVCRDLWWRK